jgi:hypothetical protein
MQSSLPAGWLAFTGRESNPLDHYKRFQITFSSPSSGLILAQRTAGFPQYGWKAGLSDETFPLVVQLKPAPGMRCLTTGLSSPFVHLVVTTMVRSESGLRTRSCTAWRVGGPPPQGPSLRSGL